ncbi:MAG TPA: hypothetical protein VGN01_07495 [Acidobacteriaceae bacterium]
MAFRPIFRLLLPAVVLLTQTYAQNPRPTVTQPQSITANSLVDQLVENAAVYRATLPSLAAREMIVSVDAGSRLKLEGEHRAEAEAIMRVMRTTPDGPLEESRQITILDGKPVSVGQHVILPTGLKGGFGGMATVFFGPNRSCFSFVLSPHPASDAPYKLSISVRPEAIDHPHCPTRAVSPMTATAFVAADTHQLTHLEWIFPAEVAAKYHRWAFASVDLAPVTLGSEIFWLPTSVIGRGTGKNQNEWVSHYSDYRRYVSTSTVLPVGSDSTVP